MNKIRRLVPIVLMVAAIFVVSLALMVLQSAGAPAVTADVLWWTLLQVFALLLVAGLLVGLVVHNRSRRINTVHQRRLQQLYQQVQATQKLVSDLDRAVRNSSSRRLRMEDKPMSSPGSKQKCNLQSDSKCEVSVSPLLSRLEAAERRLLISIDSARLSHGDQLAILESRLDRTTSTATEDSSTGVDQMQDVMRHHATDTSVHVVRQVAALLQLTIPGRHVRASISLLRRLSHGR